MVDRSHQAIIPSHLVELLRWRALQQPEKLAYTYLVDGESQEINLTYQQLDRAARVIGAHLQELEMEGQRALLLYPPGLDYIAAFFGCLYAGVVAVPAFPPRLNRPIPRIRAIVADSQARVALTTTSILNNIESRLEHAPELAALEWLNTERLDPGSASGWEEPALTPDVLAFLQYTSGSTSTPKGVMLSHGNLVHNLKIIRHGFQIEAGAMGVFWLPSYHDMGLIGGILEPMYVGEPSVLMSPTSFLQRPRRWLQAITTYKGTITGAPNFAYDLCVDKISPEDREGLDLSTLKTVFCGAEPVRLETLERFAAAFEPHGFRRDAFYPCYGLAEGTLIVSGGEGAAWPVSMSVRKTALTLNRVEASTQPEAEEQVLVSSGRTMPDQRIVIVDPGTRILCPPDKVGEIWVSGPSVAAGYWRRPEDTAHSFGGYLADTEEGPFLRTGDLGFLQDGELFVTGRLKDLIIIRGRNHYPQDIERTVSASHPAFQSNAGAAFSIEADGAERLVVVHELARQHRNADVNEVFAAVRQAIAENHDLQVHAAVLLKPLSIPMTSSGKVKRHACKTQFLEGRLKSIAAWHAQSPQEPVLELEPTVEPAVEPGAVGAISAWLVHQLAARTGLAPAQISPQEPFAAYGLDSVAAVSLTGDLEIWLGRTLSPTLAWDYPSIDALARHLAGEISARTPLISSAPEPTNSEPIAVIGMGCRFAEANGPEDFWELLRSGVDAIREVPADRWDVDQIYDADAAVPGKSNTRWGSFVRNVADFDPVFFGISPREAARMDPQQRLLLEVAWEALEKAGQAPDRLGGSQTGVFVGISSYDYSRIQYSDLARIDAYAGTGNAHSIAANRLSYTLDLRGPSMAIDTACSSSLVAVHMAMQSLRRGEAELALAGGVNLLLSPELTITFSQARMMASDGRCKTFDARADGYVRGEGCGVVVLKRLEDALRDGDSVLALLRGSAVNQDGRSNGLTAPNGPSQQAVIRSALYDGGVQPAQIGYVEAHGTGTPLGDPIEIESLRAVLDEGRAKEMPYAVGSVKTNIGHLEAAAGIAGLIKVVLSLMHEELPPHLHFQELNPYISLGGSQLEILTELRRWPRGEAPRLAGVSSFGFGGTNAHVVVSEAPVFDEVSPDDALKLERPLHLIRLSARSEHALKALASRYEGHLADLPEQELPDVGYTANVGRADFDYRLAIAAGSLQQLRTGLRAFSAGEPAAGLNYRHLKARAKPKVAFLFTGQGAQHPGMGRELYETQPVFRAALDRCAEILADHLDQPLMVVLHPGPENESLIHQTQYTQPALFALEYALAELWRSWGIEPAIVLGHSVGEYVAASVAGVFSLADGLKLITARGNLMQALPATGAMAAVFAAKDRVETVLRGYEDRLVIAAVNGPENLVVSGQNEAMREVLAGLEAAGIVARQLNVSHAFHSPLMNPILDAFEEVAGQLTFHPPQIPWVSNLTGDVLSPGAVPDAGYWRRHVREPVQFAAGMEALAAQNCEAFLEIGPGPVLTGMGKRVLTGRDPAPIWLQSLRPNRSDWQTMLDALAELYVHGAEVDWDGFDREHQRRKVPLPTYPFERDRYWLEIDPAPVAMPAGSDGAGHPVLGVRMRSPFEQYETRLDLGADSKPEATLRQIAHAAAEVMFGPGAHQVEESELAPADSIAPGPAVIQTVIRSETEGVAVAEIHAMWPDEGFWRLLARYALTPGDLHVPQVGVEEISASKLVGEEFSRTSVLRAEDEAQRPMVDRYLRSQVAEVLGMAPEALDFNQPLDMLGLDSLMAIELKNKLESHMEVSLPIVRFLEGPTIEALGDQVLESLKDPASSEGVRLTATGDLAGVHRLSINQQALWFLRELAPAGISFNVSGAVEIHGELYIEHLREAFQLLVDRHAALRTIFKVVQGEPRQEILDHVEAPFDVVDASAWDEDEIRRFLNTRAYQPFDLESGPAFRVVLLLRDEADGSAAREQRDTSESILLLSMDHIISDFWSVSVLAREVLAAYQKRSAGLPITIEPIPVHYVDYVRWQHEMLESPDGTRLADYWSEKLSGELPVLDLPTDHPRGALQTFNGGSQSAVLDVPLTEGLKRLATAHNATLYMVLLAAFQALLHRFSGKDDVLVGSVTAGRSQPELAELVGYFVNPIALRADLSGEPTFAELLARVRQTVLEAIEHQDYPPALLAEKLAIARDPSRPPLFETMFIFQKAQLPEVSALSPFALGIEGGRLEADGLVLESLPLDGQPAQFDLTLMMAELGDRLGASLQYNAGLFEPVTVRRLLGHFANLLAGIVDDPNRPISGIPLLADAEREQILVEWNNTRMDNLEENSIHRAFEAQAVQTAESVALEFEGHEMRYGELNSRANQLAHHLRGLGVGPETMVGIYMDRSLDMVVGLLGILKAGGAYIPLDPAFPAARLELMLDVAQPPVLLTETGLLESLPNHQARTVCLDRDWEMISQAPTENPSGVVRPENLAYVIFTSGSTGVPKGVQISHRSAVNFLNSMQAQPGLREEDTLLAVTTLSFDIAVLEIFLPLITGAKVEIVSREVAADGALLVDRLSDSGATVMQATPATWRMMLEAGWAPGQEGQPDRQDGARLNGRGGLKILCGGEPLPRRLADQLLDRGAEVWNMYGPTETTVWSTIQRVEPGAEPISIGRPIGNTQVYVLDRNLEPVPVGTVGELYIGGEGVARGYLNRDELTAEKFIQDPFLDDPRARLYKTGDLARFRGDGSLAFLGRADQQVKVRGFRIELGEIEAALARHAAVRESAVVAIEEAPGDVRLFGYLVLEDEAEEPSVGELRDFLKRLLPDYMLPAGFVSIEAMPLTPNGKVDRRALPAPASTRPILRTAYMAPRTPQETEIAAICSEVLGLEQIGIHDDFFELGGNSLLATRLIFLLQEHFEVKIPLARLFETPTIAGLTSSIEMARSMTGSDLSLFGSMTMEQLNAEAKPDSTIGANGLVFEHQQDPANILLTGATGFVGAFLLSDLLERTQAEIHCLVRAPDADAGLTRIFENLAAYERSIEGQGDRIRPLIGDLTQPRLGLNAEAFENLAAQLDVIFHNGAMVNFIHPYDAHKLPNVGSTREILRLASSDRIKPVHFVSTLAIFLSDETDKGGVWYEDTELVEIGVPYGGYAQSKWVAEKLLRSASLRGLPVSIYRAGPISGHSESGVWNRHDMIGGLVKACITLGAVPDLDLMLDIVPVDYVSKAIVHLGQRADSYGKAFNLASPQQMNFTQLIDLVGRLGYPIRKISFKDWKSELFDLAMRQPNEEWQVFLPLLNAIDVDLVSMPKFDQTNTLAGLDGSGISNPILGPELLQTYFKRFVETGFLQPPR